MKERFCPNCGSEIETNARFCSKCGAKIGDREERNDGFIDCNKNVERVERSDEATSYTMAGQDGPKRKKGKKGLFKAIIGLIVVAAVGVGGFVIYKMYFQQPEYDVLVNTDDMQINILIDGNENEEASANCMVLGRPKVEQWMIDTRTEEGIEKSRALEKMLGANYKEKVNLDKSEHLKNGDVVKATLNFKAPEGIKVKFTKDVLSAEKKVEGLRTDIMHYHKFPEATKKALIDQSKQKIGELDNGKYEVVEGPVAAEEYRLANTGYEVKLIFKVKEKNNTDDASKQKPIYAIVTFGFFNKEATQFKYDESKGVEITKNGETLKQLKQYFKDHTMYKPAKLD